MIYAARVISKSLTSQAMRKLIMEAHIQMPGIPLFSSCNGHCQRRDNMWYARIRMKLQKDTDNSTLPFSNAYSTSLCYLFLQLDSPVVPHYSRNCTNCSRSGMTFTFLWNINDEFVQIAVSRVVPFSGQATPYGGCTMTIAEDS